ncbi:MAG: hypothetical protein ACI8XC_002656 [Gammaproteobacteria bacterium]|jgi:hypothetical protein
MTMNQSIICFTLISALFVGGCSSTSLVYNNADWFAREKIDDYFSISGSQQRRLDRDIDNFILWHRTNELPRYAQFIDDLTRMLADGLGKDDVTLLFEEIVAARVRFAEASIASATDFLVSVNAEQLDYMNREFYQGLTEDKEELEIPAEQRREQKFEQRLDTLENWFGNFDQQQVRKVRQISDEIPDNHRYWLKQREQNHIAFLALLRSKPDPESIEQYLHERFVKREGVDDEQRIQMQLSRANWQIALIKLDRLLTEKQRQSAIDKLVDYRDDFITLSQQQANQNRSKVDR